MQPCPSMFACCNKPIIEKDSLEIPAYSRDGENDKAACEFSKEKAPQISKSDKGEGKGTKKGQDLGQDSGFESKESPKDSGHQTRESGKGKGKGDGHGKGHDDFPPVKLQYHENLPILRQQLQQFNGAYSWIREQNGPQHREARLHSGQAMQEAFKKGGYVVTASGKKHVVRFSKTTAMLDATQILSVSAGLPKLNNDPGNKTVFLQGGHPIEKASEFALEGRRCCTVNAASAHHHGGGFTSGGRHALEEAFCTQSTLYPSLDKAVSSVGGKFPYIPVDGCILSPNVEVFRRGSDQGYMMQTETVPICAVVSVAMFNKNKQVRDAPVDAPTDSKAYEEGVRKKMKAMVHAAAYAGADALIIPDLGCGVFANDPLVVGRICGEVLKEYAGRFVKVLFTGKPDFFRAASTPLGIKADDIIKVATKSNLNNTLAPSQGCCICGKPLHGDKNSTTELALVLSGKTGRRFEGLKLMHAHCETALDTKFPGCTSMTLPQATKDPHSFLKALDVDANGILSKAEVQCAVAAFWIGDPGVMEKEFEEKWKIWDKNNNGELCTDEVMGADVPTEFLSWIQACAVKK